MNPAAFLPLLLRTSAEAGVLVLVILFAQWLFRRQLSPRWRCALWLLLVVRLALPWSPASPTSLFNLLPASATPAATSAPAFPPFAIPTKPATLSANTTLPSAELAAPSLASVPLADFPTPTAAEPASIQLEPRTPGFALPSPAGISPSQASALPATHRMFSGMEIAAGIWLAGVIAWAGLVAVSTLRLNRRLRWSRPLQDEDAQALLDQCRQQLGLSANPVLVESDAISSPALYGVFRPRLLLPRGFTESFSPAQLRLVFCHELAHLRRRDLLLNWLVAGLQAIHWFNPLVWIGFSRWRADRELACDATVLEAVGADQRQEYGATILRLLETFTRRAPLPGFVGILEDKSRLRRRLEMIAQFRPSSPWPVSSMALLAGIAALCLTEARSVVPSAAPRPNARALSAAPQRLSPPAPELVQALPSPADVPSPAVAASVSSSAPETPPVAATAPADIGTTAVPADAGLASPATAINPATASPKLASLEPSAPPPTVAAAPAEPAPAASPAEAKTLPAPPAPALIFFVVGDSLAADLREPGDGWANALSRYFNPDRVGVRNVSRTGFSSRTYRTLGEWDRVVSQVHAGDVVLLQFNENEAQPLTSPDSAGTLPGIGEETREFVRADGRRETVHTQGWYLRRYIQDARSKGAIPMLLTSTPRNAWNSYEEVGHGHWKEAPAAGESSENKNTLAVGEEQKVPVIDLTRLGYLHYRLLGRELVNRLFETATNHPNRYGADLDAYLLISGLKSISNLAQRRIWSSEGALVIPAMTQVNIPIETKWYDINPTLPNAHAPGESSRVIATTVNPGPDFTPLYSGDPLTDVGAQPANEALPTIFMIGDEAVRGGRGIGAGNQWGWGDFLSTYLDPGKVNLAVRGVAGFSSRNFITQGTWTELRRWIQRRDIVLIEFGHYESTPIDDATGRGTLPGMGRETAETAQFPHTRNLDTRNIHRGRETVYTYGAYLRMYVTDARKSGGQPILVSPTPRNQWKDGKIVRDPELVRQTAEVAKEAGVPFFDLNSLLADQYDAMGQPAAERCFADSAFVTNYAGARLAAEAIVKLLLVQNPARIQNFLNPTIAIMRGGQPLQPPTSDNSKSYWQLMADYRAIDRGMSKADVVSRLGAPDRVSRNQNIYWKQGPFSLNNTPYMELDVSYNQDGRVVETKFSQGTDRDTLPSPLP